MTSLIKTLKSFSAKGFWLEKLQNHFKMQKKGSVKSRPIQKWVIYTCAEAKDGCGFKLKMFLRNFCWLGKGFISIGHVVLKLKKKHFFQWERGCTSPPPSLHSKIYIKLEAVIIVHVYSSDKGIISCKYTYLAHFHTIPNQP